MVLRPSHREVHNNPGKRRLAEARRRIIQSGAVLYLAIEAERRSRRAEAALKAAAPPSPARDELLALLQQVQPQVNR